MRACADFDAAVDELAVGAVSEPLRSDLLGHAASCPSCDLRLRELTAVADRLLLLAPPAEPPPGFETRVLGALRSRRRRPHVAIAGGLLVLVLAGAGVVLARADHADDRRVAPIVAAGGGDVLGEVVLVAEPRPHVLVTVDDPRPGPGVRSCELVLADGERVVVGSWDYRAIDTGVWAVAVDDGLLDAVSMRITDGDRVVATGRFD